MAFAALGLAIAFTLLNLPAIHFTGRIVSEVGRPGEHLATIFERTQTFFLVLGVALILRHVVAFLRDLVIIRTNEAIQYEVRRDLFGHVVRLSPDFFERRLTGGILAQMLRDAGAVNAFIMAAFITPIADVVTFCAYFAYGLTVSPKLTAVVVGVAPLYVLLFKFTSFRLQLFARRARDEFETMTGHLQERLQGVQEIQLFHAEDRESKRFEEIAGRMRRAGLAQAVWHGFHSGVALLLNSAGPIVVLLVGILEIRAGNMDVGELMAYYVMLGMMYGPISRFIEINTAFRTNLPSLAKVLSFLKTRGEVEEKPDARPLKTPVRGEVELADARFAYPVAPAAPPSSARLVLDGISFKVAPGEKVGIVGPAGCGKTTILKLVTRMIDPLSGGVRVDGQDVKVMTLGSLRQSIAVVTQRPFLFKASIRENILYARPEATEAEVEEAARAAAFHDEVVRSFPHGYDSDVGEAGALLSGGQRQRLAIARAFLKTGAKVLLLDEPTANLDGPNERLVMQALARLAEGRTCIVVAHRLNTLVDSRRIFVLDRGKIAEQGTHAELLAKGGIYSTLWAHWLAEAGAGAPGPGPRPGALGPGPGLAPPARTGTVPAVPVFTPGAPGAPGKPAAPGAPGGPWRGAAEDGPGGSPPGEARRPRDSGS